jgi:cyclic pyranopterin phosphate synthase
MPEKGIEKMSREDILTIENLEEIVWAAASLGINSIRLTGGEPLVRKGVVEIVRRVSAMRGVMDVALTTNGSLLSGFAPDLKAAGLKRVNISIDTMDREKYRKITRGGELTDVLTGIHAASDAGITPIKLNAVLMGGINEDFIRPLVEMTRETDFHVRFIEIMPIGECAKWNGKRFVSVTRVLEEVPYLRFAGTDGVSKLYHLEGAKGLVGLISPVSSHFCWKCNKLRVTSDGKLKPCLHSAEEIQLRGLHGQMLINEIRRGILGKPMKHRLDRLTHSESRRGMSAIGG